MQVETCNCFKLMFKSVLNIILLSAHKAKKKVYISGLRLTLSKVSDPKIFILSREKKLKFSMPVFRVFVLPICLFSVTDQYVGVCPPTAIKI